MAMPIAALAIMIVAMTILAGAVIGVVAMTDAITVAIPMSFATGVTTAAFASASETICG